MKNRNNLKFPNKTNTKEEIFKVNKYLTKLLSMSVNSRGEFNSSVDKKNFSFTIINKNLKKYDKDIIRNLLNAI